jgi:hypothetical protein
MNSDQTTDTTQKSTTHVFKIINTTDTICGEKCESALQVIVIGYYSL